MSDTPKTDEQAVRPWMDLQNMTTFARQLERENTTLLKERDEARRIAGAYRRVWELCAAAVDETPNHDPLPWNHILSNTTITNPEL